MGRGAVCDGLRKGMPWQRESRRRSRPAGEARCHFWGRQQEEVWTTIGNSLHQSMPMPGLSEGAVALVQATSCEKPLAHVGETGHILYRLLVARHLLYALRASGG